MCTHIHTHTWTHILCTCIHTLTHTYILSLSHTHTLHTHASCSQCLQASPGWSYDHLDHNPYGLQVGLLFIFQAFSIPRSLLAESEWISNTSFQTIFRSPLHSPWILRLEYDLFCQNSTPLLRALAELPAPSVAVWIHLSLVHRNSGDHSWGLPASQGLTSRLYPLGLKVGSPVCG